VVHYRALVGADPIRAQNKEFYFCEKQNLLTHILSNYQIYHEFCGDMGFKIVVANQIHESVKQLLAGAGALVMNDFKVPWDATALSAHCVDANALMAFMTESIDAEFLDRCPELQIIAGALKGYNNIDVAACTERGVLVTNVPDLLTEPTAELTLGLMIGVARNLIPADRLAR